MVQLLRNPAYLLPFSLRGKYSIAERLGTSQLLDLYRAFLLYSGEHLPVGCPLTTMIAEAQTPVPPSAISSQTNSPFSSPVRPATNNPTSGSVSRGSFFSRVFARA